MPAPKPAPDNHPRCLCREAFRPSRWKSVADTLWFSRFEKSLYDLIRGLRNHKGNEREYIQESLRECRKEIKGSDMGEF